MMKRIKELFEPTDMTEGRPWARIVMFCIPMLIGNIAQQLYSTVDSIVVGHYVGDNALAAVGSAGPLFNMLLVLFVGISAGVGIMVSQFFGAKDRENLSKVVGTTIFLVIASGIVMTVVGYFVSPLLIGMVTPPVGINCFVVAGTSGIKVSEIFKGVLPFVIVDLLVIALSVILMSAAAIVVLLKKRQVA